MKRYPETAKYMRIKNSDAHRLCDISDPGTVMKVPDIFAAGFTAADFLGALRNNMCR